MFSHQSFHIAVIFGFLLVGAAISSQQDKIQVISEDVKSLQATISKMDVTVNSILRLTPRQLSMLPVAEIKG